MPLMTYKRARVAFCTSIRNVPGSGLDRDIHCHNVWFHGFPQSLQACGLEEVYRRYLLPDTAVLTLVNFYQTTLCSNIKTAIFILAAVRTSDPIAEYLRIISNPNLYEIMKLLGFNYFSPTKFMDGVNFWNVAIVPYKRRQAATLACMNRKVYKWLLGMSAAIITSLPKGRFLYVFFFHFCFITLRLSLIWCRPNT
jgi:hypothetical protein